MAALHKNGTEVQRLRRTLPADQYTEGGFVEVSLRSNAWVLRRQVMNFRATEHLPARRHDYGWKRYYKLPMRDTIAQHVEAFERRGYVIVEG